MNHYLKVIAKDKNSIIRNETIEIPLKEDLIIDLRSKKTELENGPSKLRININSDNLRVNALAEYNHSISYESLSKSNKYRQNHILIYKIIVKLTKEKLSKEKNMWKYGVGNKASRMNQYKSAILWISSWIKLNH